MDPPVAEFRSAERGVLGDKEIKIFFRFGYRQTE